MSSKKVQIALRSRGSVGFTKRASMRERGKNGKRTLRGVRARNNNRPMLANSRYIRFSVEQFVAHDKFQRKIADEARMAVDVYVRTIFPTPRIHVAIFRCVRSHSCAENSRRSSRKNARLFSQRTRLEREAMRATKLNISAVGHGLR